MNLSHTRWDCKYQVVFIPKCRRKVQYVQIRKELGRVFSDLARQKEFEIISGSLQPHHGHMEIRIPPKHAVLG
jgi:putative transposase